MRRGIDIEPDNVPELLREFRVLRQLERTNPVRRKSMSLQNACTERRLTPATLASIRPVQWVVSPGGGASARSTTCFTALGGSGALPGLRVLSRKRPATPSAMKRTCHAYNRLRFARSAHDLGRAAAIGGCEDDIGAPDMLLGRAAIRDDRFKPTAIVTRDLDDNPCSHAESLNCFGRLGNRPNASDH